MHHSNPYVSYYLNQAGSGVGQVYAGAPYQKGHGIGSFMSSVWKTIMPLFRSGAKHVGTEILKTGANVLNDIAVDNATPKESFRKRAREASQNLSSKLNTKIMKMTGSGGGGAGCYKRARLLNKAHLQARAGKNNNKKKKARKTKPKRKVNNLHKKGVRDIFS